MRLWKDYKDYTVERLQNGYNIYVDNGNVGAYINDNYSVTYCVKNAKETCSTWNVIDIKEIKKLELFCNSFIRNKKEIYNMNKNKILVNCKKLGYELGCYSSNIDKLNKSNIKKILGNIKYESDTKVFLNKQPYIVQIDKIDSEIDFIMISLEEYNGKYDEWEN